MKAGKWLPLAVVAVLVTAVAWALAAWLARLPWLPLWGQSLAVFAAVKLVGDAARLGLLGRHGVLFYEDIIKELAAFLFLGGLAALAMALARRYIGGQVSPAVPAVAAYLTSLLVPPGKGPGA